jgi:5-methylcytosine-specific restriction enzyme A
MTDVGTTARKKFTPTQRLKIFEAAKGTCALCGQQIKAGDAWIVEHLRPLGLGGSNDKDNTVPVHAQCAHSKTFGETGDLSQIAKAKRVKMRHLGISKSKVKIQSRGFCKAPRSKIETTKVVARKSMYEDVQ